MRRSIGKRTHDSASEPDGAGKRPPSPSRFPGEIQRKTGRAPHNMNSPVVPLFRVAEVDEYLTNSQIFNQVTKTPPRPDAGAGGSILSDLCKQERSQRVVVSDLYLGCAGQNGLMLKECELGNHLVNNQFLVSILFSFV